MRQGKMKMKRTQPNKHCALDISKFDSPEFTVPGRDTKPYYLHISKAIFNYTPRIRQSPAFVKRGFVKN